MVYFEVPILGPDPDESGNHQRTVLRQPPKVVRLSLEAIPPEAQQRIEEAEVIARFQRDLEKL